MRLTNQATRWSELIILKPTVLIHFRGCYQYITFATGYQCSIWNNVLRLTHITEEELTTSGRLIRATISERWNELIILGPE